MNAIYIDKSHHVANLVDSGGKYFFLSRPRRFGKSLFLDTLKQAFSGNKAVFKGLHLEQHWDWSKQYPIIHLNFASGSAFESKKNLMAQIDDKIEFYAAKYQVKLNSKTRYGQFDELITKIAQVTGLSVVLLVDEYDKPILDVIDNREEAKENRELLKGLYNVIKTQDSHLRFVFLTGVSKFSKVSFLVG